MFRRNATELPRSDRGERTGVAHFVEAMRVASVLSFALVTFAAGCVQREVRGAPAVAAPVPRAASPSQARPALRPSEQGPVASGTIEPAKAVRASPPISAEVPPREPPPFRAELLTRETDAQRLSKRIANSSPAACRAELKRRKLPVSFLGGNVSGVAVPVRLTGELRGVMFRTPGKKSVYGIVDCRLVIVLDELAGLLAEHGVKAVHVDNMYRPRSRLPGRKKKSQHAYGLAIDIYGFTLADGSTLVVERDFDGKIGAVPCGPEADLAPNSSAPAVALRNLTCAIARARLFNHLLTPDYDAAHRNHLHADISRGGNQYVVR